MAKELIDRLNVYLYKENKEIIDFLEKADNKSNVIKFALKYLMYHEGSDISVPHDTSDKFLNIYLESTCSKTSSSSSNDSSTTQKVAEVKSSIPDCFDD